MDEVSIEIPASPVYVGVVRLVASGLASRLDFTWDDIEDLKIAVDELCSYLTGTRGRDGTLEIRFTVLEKGIEITGEARFAPGFTVKTELTDFSRQILDMVADSATLDRSDGLPRFRLVKTRRGQ